MYVSLSSVDLKIC